MTIYTTEEEMELMSFIWSPAIADDPLAFVMHMYPWGEEGTPLERFKGPRRWQKNVLRELRDAIRENRRRELEPDGKPLSKADLFKVLYDTFRKAIASGRGIGKSALVSWLAHWMMSTRIGSSTVISANTEKQLKDVTWSELGKWFGMALNSHWFDVAATTVRPQQWLKDAVLRDLRKDTRYWQADAKLWSEENPDAYAGVHNMDGVMLIFDEASGIADNIWAVAAGFFTENTPNRFWFAFSNPRRNRGYFFECFQGIRRTFWSTDNIDARTVEDTDKAYYKQFIEEHGADSSEAHVEVYGEFPEQGEDQFISPTVVNNAMVRPLYKDPHAPIVVGVDPARSGVDSTVIVIRQGRDLLEIRRLKNPDLMDTVDDVINVINEFQPDLVVIDEGGVGAGVVDALKRQRFDVRGVNFSNKPKNPRMYGNKRAEMWGDMRNWLSSGSMERVSRDKRLKSDLVAPMVKYDAAGVIFLEGKKEMRSRGAASPDSADALCVTFAFPVGTRKRIDPRRDDGYSTSGQSSSWMGA